jgi:hydrogenase maturation protease
MPRVLIIGCGNTLRGDDAIGYLAAEELSAGALPAAAEVLVRHQLAPELAETISEFDVALFVDATQDGEPGELRCQPVEPSADDSGLTHSASPAALLFLARELYGHAPQGWLFSLCGESFDLTEELSQPVRDALPGLTEMVGQKAAECAGVSSRASEPTASESRDLSG